MRLSKHHGLGNDFLVLFDEATPEAARRWCDRRRGIGADGLLLGLAPDAAGVDADLRMVLFNADGSRAEMSGNGIRCLAQAELRRRGERAGEVRVLTDAGLRVVDVVAGPDPLTVTASVGMGCARELPLPAEVPAARAMAVDLGNPHLVLLAEPGHDLVALGRRFADVNVELVTPAADGITMLVHERGVGPTEACGTGACASAYAARAWGIGGSTTTVHMPGGDIEVRLDGNAVTLVGPATYIATVEVP